MLVVKREEDVSVEVFVEDHYEAAEEGGGAIAPETWQTWFKTWFQGLSEDVSPERPYELSLRLTTDAEVQTLNAQYRQKDQPTDVLSFAALEVDYPTVAEMPEDEPVYLGDIVISVDTARRQAQQQNHSLETELAWLASHGLLHLLGWDHPDDDSLIEMLAQQENLLKTIGFTVGDRVEST